MALSEKTQDTGHRAYAEAARRHNRVVHGQFMTRQVRYLMPPDPSDFTLPSGESPHVLRHKVRSPLTVIIAYADTLISESQAGGVPRERLIERLDRIRTAAGRIAHLMDELDLAADREDEENGKNRLDRAGRPRRPGGSGGSTSG